MTLVSQSLKPHHLVERHSETIDDPYAWRKPSNWKQVMTAPDTLDSEIRRYPEAAHAYTEVMLAPIHLLRERLFRKMGGRIEADESSAPFRDGDHLYYRRISGGSEYPQLCHCLHIGDAPEEVLLDADGEAARHAFFRLRNAANGPDHRLLAYTADTTGAE